MSETALKSQWEDHRIVPIPVNGVSVHGRLDKPFATDEMVICFGPEDSDFRPMSRRLNAHGMGTLRVDLGFEGELSNEPTLFQPLGLPALTQRLVNVTDWTAQKEMSGIPKIGYWTNGVGGAAAILAAVERPATTRALVLKNARLDLVGGEVAKVVTPTLFLVSTSDKQLIGWHRETIRKMRCPVKVHFIDDDSAFGNQISAASLTRDWFENYLRPEETLWDRMLGFWMKSDQLSY